MAEIKVLKDQAKKERQKKAAAHYASQTFKVKNILIALLDSRL